MEIITHTSRDCESFFGKESLKPISNDDDVTCVTHFSKVVPLEGGEVRCCYLYEVNLLMFSYSNYI